MKGNFLKRLRTATKGSSVVIEPTNRSITRRLRASRRPCDTSKVRLQLVEVDGVMEWEETTLGLPDLGQFRRRTSANPPQQDAIAEIEFDRLPPSQITSFLMKRDQILTPNRGLRRFDPLSGKFSNVRSVSGASALVLIHGTFSNSDNVIKNFQSTESGKEFLTRAARKYQQNLFLFDHPTLSVGPILNALDLAKHFEGTKIKVDIVCHSRGGLVGRWWSDVIEF